MKVWRFCINKLKTFFIRRQNKQNKVEFNLGIGPLLQESIQGRITVPEPHILPEPDDLPLPEHQEVPKPEPVPSSRALSLVKPGMEEIRKQSYFRNMLLFGKPEKKNLDEVSLALQSWKNALMYFETVSDPDLIDFAIYDLEAAKRRYLFLLKCARQKEMV